VKESGEKYLDRGSEHVQQEPNRTIGQLGDNKDETTVYLRSKSFSILQPSLMEENKSKIGIYKNGEVQMYMNKETLISVDSPTQTKTRENDEESPTGLVTSAATPVNSLKSYDSIDEQYDKGLMASDYQYDEYLRKVSNLNPYRPGSFLLGYRKSQERRNYLERYGSVSRKLSTKSGMSTEMYNERLKRVKQYLNREEKDGNHTDTSSILDIDLEGIEDRDLLLFPYTEIYERKISISVEKGLNVSKRTSTSPKLTAKTSR